MAAIAPGTKHVYCPSNNIIIIIYSLHLALPNLPPEYKQLIGFELNSFPNAINLETLVHNCANSKSTTASDSSIVSTIKLTGHAWVISDATATVQLYGGGKVLGNPDTPSSVSHHSFSLHICLLLFSSMPSDTICTFLCIIYPQLSINILNRLSVKIASSLVGFPCVQPI